VRPLTLAIVVTAGLGVACGGSSSDPATTSATTASTHAGRSAAGGAAPGGSGGASLGGAGGVAQGGAGGAGGVAPGGSGGASQGGAGGAGGAPPPTVILPKTGLDAAEIGVLVNADDPQSVAIADAFTKARGIPAAHVVSLKLPAGDTLSPADFATAKAAVDAALGPDVQALAITWTQPYRVDCMSVTSAFALGYDTKWCGVAGQCAPTALQPVFDDDGTAYFTDHGIRPAMMLAAGSVASGQALVARGLAAEATRPTGKAWLVRTTDPARSVRWPDFQAAVSLFDHPGGIASTYVDNSAGAGSDHVEGEAGVLFYFTGLASVPKIETNTYLPGAVADHLTSFGGMVPTSWQMSAMAWLEAGVTASYGTVVEPCNFTQKFPQASVMMGHYLRGATALEAYWKSVRMPGEGLFVGDPLARPWAGAVVDFDPATRDLVVHTTALRPKKGYVLESGPAADGPFTKVADVIVDQPGVADVSVKDATEPFYRLRRGP
jgi:uncharacterized protein (TIGR03790 family)